MFRDHNITTQRQTTFGIQKDMEVHMHPVANPQPGAFTSACGTDTGPEIAVCPDLDPMRPVEPHTRLKTRAGAHLRKTGPVQTGRNAHCPAPVDRPQHTQKPEPDLKHRRLLLLSDVQPEQPGSAARPAQSSQISKQPAQQRPR